MGGQPNFKGDDMIFGVFGGNSLEALKMRKQKIETEQLSFKDALERAVFDRTTAMTEIANEIAELKKL